MPALSNPRRERFAQLIADKKMTHAEAYVEAGYKLSKSSKGNAGKMACDPEIKARVAELLEAGAERAEVSVSRVVQELARIGLSDIRQLFDEDGSVRRVEDLPDDIAAAIKKVKVSRRDTEQEDLEGRRIYETVHEYELWDKNSGLEKLAKYLGMFVEKHEHKHTGVAPSSVDASVVAALAQKLVD